MIIDTYVCDQLHCEKFNLHVTLAYLLYFACVVNPIMGLWYGQAKSLIEGSTVLNCYHHKELQTLELIYVSDDLHTYKHKNTYIHNSVVYSHMDTGII